jgi:hypothetical protein
MLKIISSTNYIILVLFGDVGGVKGMTKLLKCFWSFLSGTKSHGYFKLWWSFSSFVWYIVDDPFWECEDNVVALKSMIERKMSFGSKFAITNHFGPKLLQQCEGLFSRIWIHTLQMSSCQTCSRRIHHAILSQVFIVQI